MSKLHSDQLFRLIHAMNASEKRYFKRFLLMHGGKESHTGKLFDAYCKLKTFDEERLVKSEKYLSGFAQHKQHLLAMVLRSLRSYHSSDTRESQVLGMLADVSVLRSKRQYTTALSVLNKAMRIAKASDNFLQQLEITRKRDEIRFDARAPIAVEENSEILETESELIQRYDEQIRNRSHARNMYSMHLRDVSVQRKYKIPKSRPRGFQALRFYLTAQTALAYSRMDLQKAHAWSAEHVRLVESNPEYILDYPHEYMKVLSSRLVIEDLLGKYEDCFVTINSLRTLQKKPEYRVKLKMYESHTFVYTFTAEINALVRALEFDKAVALIPAVIRGLEKFRDKITLAEIKVFYLNFSLIFLNTGNAKSAYRWSAKALNEMFDERRDLNFTLIITRLLALYDRNENQFLLRQLKKDAVLLAETGTAPELTRKLLELLRTLAVQSSERKRNTLLLQFTDVINSPALRTDKKDFFAQFELVPWIQAKIHRTTIAAELLSANRS